jgi:hypothetical protein
MTRRSKLWRIGAGLFVVINFGGAIYAIAMGEPMHAATHAVLLTLGLGAYLTWRVARAPRANATPQIDDARLEYLQRSVDAIALEVERIGEAQRFHEKLRGEQEQITPPKKPQSEP